MTSAYAAEVTEHYERVWNNSGTVRKWDRGPVSDLPADFCVLQFAPSATRRFWTYATCCMSQPEDPEPCEVHLFSPLESDSHVELLTFIAHYHRTAARLNWGDTVNFGRPWLVGSRCSYGLISLPYLDGPALEKFLRDGAEPEVRCLWLLPITEEEREFKKANGIEALEQKLEAADFNYLDPLRESVV